MKVLILHQHFNTPAQGGAVRSYYLAKALVERGIPTIVITASNEKKYSVVNTEGIEVHYLPIPYDNSFGFFDRGKSFARFALKSISIAQQIGHITLCYAISTPLTTGLAAIRLKQKLKIPFIFEVGDLWPEAPIQLGVVKNYFLKQSLYALEKKIYNEAKAIVALSDPIQKAIQKIAKDKRIHVLPNMADCDFYKPEEKNPEWVQRYHLAGKMVVSYIGTAGVANGLDYFIECANVARKNNLPIHFILAGGGARLEHLQSAAQKLQLTNITFTGHVSRQTVKEILNGTDVAMVCYKNVPVLETGSPNKYFDALAAGKPVIVNFGGWIKDEIERNQCGFGADPKHPTDCINKILLLINDPLKLNNYQKNARTLAETKYSREKLSSLFFEKIINA
ncbi:MAG: glycosyltransferase family 4 protein [Bacteroidetes bacterium]|nr:glycosyltransferase family 4 protein [Bacteroidota bacterium]MBS1539491.1 glycosyltransferase family 4 protein [Bacteroidota bacterium]